MNFFRFVAAFAFFVGLLTSVCASAQTFLIRDVKVSGNKRADSSVIVDNFERSKDMKYTQEDLDEYLKKLFATGIFSDVKMVVSGDTLSVNVVENKIFNRIVFEGNENIEDEDLQKAAKVFPREPFSPAKIKEAVHRIRSLYAAKGMSSTVVCAEVINRDGRVDLVFKINEGKKVFVRSIVFVGNKKFSDNVLLDSISTKEYRWYRFFSNDDTYDSARMKYDGELLRQKYLDAGYVDFNISSVLSEMAQDTGDFHITFAMTEGERYRFGKTKVVSEASGVRVSDRVLECIAWQEGDWFCHREVQSVSDLISKTLNDEGHPFVDVVPVPNKDEKNRLVGVTFVIKKAPEKYVRSVKVRGNFGTESTVIMRELDVASGDSLCSAKISESEKNLADLDYFESVKIEEVPTPNSSQKDLNVIVKEKSTGDIVFGAGYSTFEGPIGRAGITERNFLGKGHVLNLDTNFSKRSFGLNAGYTNPRLFGRKLAGGVDIFHSSYRGDTRGTFGKEGGYRQLSSGVGTRVGYQINKNMAQVFGYRIKRDKTRLRDGWSSPFMQLKRATNYVSSVSHDLIYDKTVRSAGDPVGGYFLKVENELAGVGGSVRYLSNIFSASKYFSLDERQDWVIRCESKYGVIGSLGYIRFVDLFNMGGGSIPFGGFDENGIGPKDRVTGDFLGGRQFYSAALKLYFPLGLPREIPVKGIVYIQSGSLWNSGMAGEVRYARERHHYMKRTWVINDKFYNRISFGGGVLFNTPLGKLGAMFSRALVYKKQDDRRNFMLLWGQDF
ncbi:outer membrane protein assembly factor BamA [Candidatus Hydrogenosomobacter endosymbioticus]|uniref:Outer membrane protein assembly factor BamA n=1 Tax=Candidatus Hydrogenosomobacter endosymbioticus TaxID=2558174 RepID=A0ABM7V8L4_9PROT|nr:outer membrane protein assembly factor BamA [Candidatus Hydrogenosomobacter endosymbioticus]BDB96112.1 outer membrane protein assembly factor BamA [Candidatus Hydrogenosomobacter endosymbioticus]